MALRVRLRQDAGGAIAEPERGVQLRLYGTEESRPPPRPSPTLLDVPELRRRVQLVTEAPGACEGLGRDAHNEISGERGRGYIFCHPLLPGICARRDGGAGEWVKFGNPFLVMKGLTK